MCSPEELVCSSSGNEISEKLWVCEKIAAAGIEACADKTFICQECLGAGASLSTSKNQI